MRPRLARATIRTCLLSEPPEQHAHREQEPRGKLGPGGVLLQADIGRLEWSDVLPHEQAITMVSNLPRGAGKARVRGAGQIAALVRWHLHEGVKLLQPHGPAFRR